jgi:hypothetical protein
MVLNRGSVSFVGDVADALDHYHELAHADTAAANAKAADLTQQQGNEMLFTGGAVVEVSVDASGDAVVVDLRATFEREVRDPVIGLMASQIGGGPVYMLHTLPGEYRGVHGPDRPLRAQIRLDQALLSGRYAVQASVTDEGGKVMLGRGRAAFAIDRAFGPAGIVDLGGEIAVDGRALPLSGHRT